AQEPRQPLITDGSCPSVFTRLAMKTASRQRSPGGIAPGDRMGDGTIYAGISPDSGKPMYTTPADKPLTHTFNGAAEHAKLRNAATYRSHDDWLCRRRPSSMCCSTIAWRSASLT